MRMNFSFTDPLATRDLPVRFASRRIVSLLGIYGLVALVGAAVHVVSQVVP